MKERCFADRKDGTCHALIYKDCRNCRFYAPRSSIKNNPIYEYSYEDKRRCKFEQKVKKVAGDIIMKKND